MKDYNVECEKLRGELSEVRKQLDYERARDECRERCKRRHPHVTLTVARYISPDNL